MKIQIIIISVGGNVLKGKIVQNWSRKIHIYSSMMLLLALLFFAFTGLTLNRPHLYVAKSEVVEYVISLPETLFSAENGYRPNRDELVEVLKQHSAIKGIPSELSIYVDIEDGQLLEGEVELDFKSPGYNAVVFVDVLTKQAEVSTTDYGLVAWLNDLHKGRNTGPSWDAFIDFVSVIMILFTITGGILLLPKKKTLLTAMKWTAVGTVVTVLCYLFSF
ncbi:PepSY-associated TM helix domain-containing protein [Vibrio methylphosphonaticus]|uniref:PepSY-associated TM helix domain-containing protein n=1 Tax=Vibrio methylphosphonaticus TaxID=2946866 RepID=UPI00202A3094|nr:PepSY-associated TM helix domain-containing protein [Vibrio methylphosphonaticus]MCL9776252.1 PepSY-associated TM helix domain-containing protein [Vibrio methylphosphonaticus]